MGSETVEPNAAVILDPDAVLTEYRRRQMLEHLIGPVFSLFLHIILMVIAMFFLVGNRQPREASELEITLEEMEIKTLTPQVNDELKKIEQITEEAVPTVEPPEVKMEAMEAATPNFTDAMMRPDDSVDVAAVVDLRQNVSPLKLSQAYAGRISKEARANNLKKFGGSALTERAVLKALRWLKEHQSPDGSWSRERPVAMASLGLLAFMAHGETPASPEFGLTVRKATEYLITTMESITEEPPPPDNEWPYRNAMMTYALAESYGLSKVPFIKPALEKGLRFIVKGQQPGGGWDYQYGQGARWDLTTTAWQVQALKAGYIAGAETTGVYEAMDKGAVFLKDTALKNGRFQFVPLYEGDWGVQACGTLCLQLMGFGGSGEVREIARAIAEQEKVEWNDNGLYLQIFHPCYNWYYETQVMFHAGQSAWRKWNEQFSTVLVKHQHEDGHWEIPGEGSEHPEYDPYYTTTLNCLSLQVYYRYLPSYKVVKKIARKTTNGLNDLDSGPGLNIE